MDSLSGNCPIVYIVDFEHFELFPIKDYYSKQGDIKNSIKHLTWTSALPLFYKNKLCQNNEAEINKKVRTN